MKVNFSTLAGKVTQLEVVNDGVTIRDVKRGLYKRKKYSGPVTLVRGNDEVLKDGSTLKQLNITEGDTINLVVEPEQEIKIEFHYLGSNCRGHFHTSLSVAELKQWLLTQGFIVFPPKDFCFETEGSVPNLPGGRALKEESMPLFFNGITANATLHVKRTFRYFNLHVVGDPTHCSKRLPTSTTVAELISWAKENLCSEETTDVGVLVKRDEITVRILDPENAQTLENQIDPDLDLIVICEDKLFRSSRSMYYEGQKVAQVGVEDSDSMKDVKLRALYQTGLPWNNIAVVRPRDDHYKDLNMYVVEHEEVKEEEEESWEEEDDEEDEEEEGGHHHHHHHHHEEEKDKA